jgi:hypothetical protein
MYYRVKAGFLHRCTFVGPVRLVRETVMDTAKVGERFLESITHRESYIR